MRKKFIGVVLVFAMIFSMGCSSSQESSASKDEPEETYSRHETSFGLSYEIPDSWKVPDTNTDTDIYYYKREIGSGDGMLYIAYQELDGDILDEALFNEYVEGMQNTAYDIQDLKSNDSILNNINVKK